MNAARILASLWIPLAGTALAAQGDLDPTFGDHGRAWIAVHAPGDYGRFPVVHQDDGKALVVGTDGTAFTVTRLRSDGSVDPTFGVDGVARLAVGSGGGSARAYDVKIAPDGKIVVAGQVSGPDRSAIMAVARFTRDGAADAGFGGNGAVVLDSLPGAPKGYAQSAVVLDDGSIVLAGALAGSNGAYAFSFVQLTPQGALDPGFGIGGISRIDRGDAGASASAIVRLADGRYVACGTVNQATGGTFMRAMRLTASGPLDAGFGKDGVADVIDGAAYDCVLRPDGRVVIAGTEESAGYARVVQLTPAGALDVTFGGGDGVADLALVCAPTSPCDTGWGVFDIPARVAVLDHGEIAVGVAAANLMLAAVRLGPDGTPDSVFGPNGARFIDLGSGKYVSFTYGAGLSPDGTGKLLVVGGGNTLMAASINLTDAPGASVVGAASQRSIVEEEKSVVVAFRRTGSAEGTVSVDYATVDGAAVAGSDYEPVSGTLVWADGDTAPKTIRVTIIDDAAKEPNEDFMIQLSNPVGTGLATETALVFVAPSDPPTSDSGSGTSTPPPSAGGNGNGVGGGGGAAGPVVLGLLALLALTRVRRTTAVRRQPWRWCCPK